MNKDNYKYNPFTGKMDNAGVDVDIANNPAINKLVVTLDGTRYAIARDIIETPATPALTAGGTFTRSKTVAISCATSDVTIRYTTDGSDPDLTHGTVGTSVTLQQDTSVESKTYTVKAVAIKNGEVSDVASQEYTINRQVATPVITKSGSKVSISCTTTGASIYYTTDGSTPTASSTLYDDSNKPDIAFKTIKAIAILSEWSNSGVATKNACYIGQAASISAESDIYALANKYLQDTFTVGETKSLDFGSSAQYVWICVPNTAARNMAIKSDGFDVPLQSAAGATVGNYRVWRSEATLKETFDFNFIS